MTTCEINELVKNNLGLVKNIVAKFNPKNTEEYDILYSAGQEGLWKAAQKFNINRNIKFTTYAYRPIRWAMIKAIKNFRTKNNIGSFDQVGEIGYLEKDIIQDYLPILNQEETVIIESLLARKTLKEIRTELGYTTSVLRTKVINLYNKIRECNT